MKYLIAITVCALFAIGSANAADVKPLFEKECAKCHGADGKGQTKMGQKLGVKDYTSAKVQDAVKDEDMAKAIKKGVAEEGKTKMKAFDTLSDDEVKGLVQMMRAFKGK